MSVTYSMKDAVAVGSDGWVQRVAQGDSEPVAPEPAPTKLVLTGPTTGEPSVAGDFLVGTDNARTVAVTVSISVTNGTPSAATVLLPVGSDLESFTVTPAAEGTMVVTVTATGLTQAQVTSTIDTPEPEPDFDAWVSRLDPSQTWGSAESGTNEDGESNAPELQIELDGSAQGPTSPSSIKLTSGTYSGNSPTYCTRTATTVHRNGENILAIEANYDGSGKTMFVHTLHKTEHHWKQSTKWRAEIWPAGAPSRSSWGTTLWGVFGIYFNETMLKYADEGTFHLTQLKINSKYMTGPTVAMFLKPGNGNAAEAKITYAIKRYGGTGWPNNPKEGDEKTVENGEMVKAGKLIYPAVHYFVFKVRLGCGYADPNEGAIYGNLDSSFPGYTQSYAESLGVNATDGKEYGCTLWHAAGDSGAISKIKEYKGFIGTPWEKTNNNVKVKDGNGRCAVDGHWRLGLYGQHKFNPSSLPQVRTHAHLGEYVFRDQPGVLNETNLLAWFRALHA